MFFLSKPDSIDLLCGKQSIEEEIHTCAVSMWCLEQAKALKACRFYDACCEITKQVPPARVRLGCPST